MSPRDAFDLAARSLRRRFGRAVLTVSAVALAAALLSALLIVAGAARTRVLDQLSRGGPLAGIQVAAAAPDPTQVDVDDPAPGPARVLDDAAAARIRAVPGVRSVVPIMTTPVFALAGGQGTEIRTTLIGFDLRRADELPLTIDVGRLPSPDAVGEVAVTEAYLHRRGLEPADARQVIGTELELGAPRLFRSGFGLRFRGRWTRATIVGVVAQQAGSGEVIAPLAAVRAARNWAAGGLRDSRYSFEPSLYSGVFVVARNLSEVGAVRAAITSIGYSTSSPENLIASVRRYLHVVEIVLTGIGVIALVIAALGITNALLAAVRERRREIGVLKAIGARDRDVRRVFLFEAGVLGATGGLVGTVCGWLIARVMGAVVNGYLAQQRLRGVHVGFPVLVLVGGVVGAAVLSVVAGVLPAQRAAKLPARQAMSDT